MKESPQTQPDSPLQSPLIIRNEKIANAKSPSKCRESISPEIELFAPSQDDLISPFFRTPEKSSDSNKPGNYVSPRKRTPKSLTPVETSESNIRILETDGKTPVKNLEPFLQDTQSKELETPTSGTVLSDQDAKNSSQTTPQLRRKSMQQKREQSQTPSNYFTMLHEISQSFICRFL